MSAGLQGKQAAERHPSATACAVARPNHLVPFNLPKPPPTCFSQRALRHLRQLLGGPQLRHSLAHMCLQQLDLASPKMEK